MGFVRRGPAAGSQRTLRLDVSYEGTAYNGWQRQAKGTSVQGVLERVLSKVANEKVSILGASRTDSGVHARHQVASMSLKKSQTPASSFLLGANTALPPDIRVTAAQDVDLWFHPNFQATGKTYRYFFNIGISRDVFARRYSWHIRKDLDWAVMEKAAKVLIGRHDFSTFQGAGTVIRSPIRTVDFARFGEGPFGVPFFEISADGFLKYMVRNIVGTLVEIGQGRRKRDSLRDILKAKNRKAAGRKAPPEGLFLWEVRYDDLSDAS